MPPHYRRFTAAEKAKLYRMRDEGKSAAEISAATGISRTRVVEAIRPPRDDRKQHIPTPDDPAPAPVAARPLPIAYSEFIKPPTLAQLMGRR